MTITGLRTTGNFVANERPQNWREGILMLYPNGMAPLTALTALMKSESVDDVRYNWWEKSLLTYRVKMNENLDGSETVITLVSGSFAFKLGDILMVEKSGELLWVAANPVIDTEVTVLRGQFGTSAATVTVASENPYLLQVGSAYEEASASPKGVAFDPSQYYNFLQTFRDSIEASRRAQKTRLRTKPQKQEAKRECLELHSLSLEKAFWFGMRSEGTLNGKPITTTGGVDSFIHSDNKLTFENGEVSLDRLEDIMKRVFDYGSNEKVAFLGNTALLAIGKAVRKNSTYNIQGGLTEYGMKVTRLVSPFGELVMKTHPLFNQISADTGASYYALDSTMYILDAKNLKYRYFSGDDMRYETKLEIPGIDGYKEGYLSDCGLEVHHPRTHLKISQIKTAVVDGDET